MTILLLGDSYGLYSVPYLCQYVKKIVGTHWNGDNVDMKYLFESYKSAIVILQLPGFVFFGSDGKSLFNEIRL